MAFPREIRDLSTEIGRAGVNALYPNEFEYYAVTLELTDSQGDTVEYLTFPVSPESMMYDNATLVNVKKSMAGVTALDNETFQPRNIEMTGTFGRKFKILLNNELGEVNIRKSEDSTVNGHFNTFKANAVNVKTAIFDPKLKTGYGTLKVLEAIIEKSRGLDKNNQPHRLYLYNPALGHNWLVKVRSVNFQQDRTNSNMLWKYNLQLAALAPVESVNDANLGGLKLSESTRVSVLQAGLSKLLNKISSSI